MKVQLFLTTDHKNDHTLKINLIHSMRRITLLFIFFAIEYTTVIQVTLKDMIYFIRLMWSVSLGLSWYNRKAVDIGEIYTTCFLVYKNTIHKRF